MRRPLALAAVLAIALTCGPARAATPGPPGPPGPPDPAGGPPAPKPVEWEVSAFHQRVSHSLGDWDGQRLIVRLFPTQAFTMQVEGVHEIRGKDEGELLATAFWLDLNSHAYVSAGASAGRHADFYPAGRVDLEMHVKVGHARQLVLGLGAGRARFSNSDVNLASLGIARYFTHGMVGYKLLLSKEEARSVAAAAGSGTTHLLEATIGSDEGRAGRLDMRWLQGVDLLSEFGLGGTDLSLRSRVATVGWRRWWGRHVGTGLELEWADRETLFTREGGEVRVLLR